MTPSQALEHLLPCCCVEGNDMAVTTCAVVYCPVHGSGLQARLIAAERDLREYARRHLEESWWLPLIALLSEAAREVG